MSHRVPTRSSHRPRLLAVVLALSLGAILPGVASAQPICDPGWKFTNITHPSTTIRVIGGPWVSKNLTDNRIQFSVSRTVSGTVGFSASGEFGGGVNLIIVAVEAKFNVTLQASMSVSTTVSTTMWVSAHSTGYIEYGVFRFGARGHNYYITSNCTITTNNGYVTTWSPDYQGFKVWQTSP